MSGRGLSNEGGHADPGLARVAEEMAGAISKIRDGRISVAAFASVADELHRVCSALHPRRRDGTVQTPSA